MSHAKRSDPLSERDPASIPSATWRSEINGASGANLVLGIWLVVSPFLLPYRTADPSLTQVIVGVVIAALALTRVNGGAWKSWVSWANVGFGAGIVVLAAVVAESGAARWNGIVAGTLIVMLATLSASASESASTGA